MARPRPRLPPVTRAVLPVRSNIRRRRPRLALRLPEAGLRAGRQEGTRRIGGPLDHRRSGGVARAEGDHQDPVPALMRPAATASTSAIGTDAADVLPYFSMLR